MLVLSFFSNANATQSIGPLQKNKLPSRHWDKFPNRNHVEENPAFSGFNGLLQKKNVSPERQFVLQVLIVKPSSGGVFPKPLVERSDGCLTAGDVWLWNKVNPIRSPFRAAAEQSC